MSDFALRPLSAIATIITGSTPSSGQTDSWGDECDFITPSDQSDSLREATPARRLSATGISRLKSRVVPARSTNLTCIGSTIGKVSMTRSAAITNQQINSIIARESISDAGFIYYMIKNWSGSLKDHASGSATPIINKSVLARFHFLVPPIGDQRAIAEVLGALDDKIAANTLMAKNSIQLLQSIHEHLRLRQREVRKAPLGSLATTVLGGTPSRDNAEFWINGSVAWINSGKANETIITQPSEWITESALEKSATKLMPRGTTVVAITGATLGQIARLEISACGNQSLVGIWSGNPDLNDWLYLEVNSRMPELLTKATGAAQQHVNKKDVDSLLVEVADERTLGAFGDRARPLLDLCVVKELESGSLAKLRDLILPQLMSGKLRVKEAEVLVEGLV
ncbi:restriction endonuclease subunit S [Arthrobacter sp. Bz4]|uniref:restriction endonuclease subunit S n=1 Tax=Arthrobacter sp. Bz4 TaxID=2171979 RepID=UPI000D511FB9|nr:restriction endonuclease subunit S [Arthrobacter sp. Bz4]PVE19959.1 hypothetical protein DDA93_00910 [Arthrobacter sp. Bz4]